MRKLILFMHTSLDGFVAGQNGEMNWILADNEMFGYAGKQTNDTDTALYGRVTFQLMESYWPTAASQPNATKHDIEHATWYNKVKKVVASKTLKMDGLGQTIIIRENLTNEIGNLKKEAGKNIVMFGSPTVAHSLIEENLIDEYWLFVNPIILGQGIPLFKSIKNRIKLKLVMNEAFASGVVCLQYTT